MAWIIETEGYPEATIADHGNRFLIGNGYLGVRGTLEECDKSHLVAVNLAGIYDKVGNGWREPLNAPNPFYTKIMVDGIALTAFETKEAVYKVQTHKMTLDYRFGVFSRKTVWQLGESAQLTLATSRFASMANPHQVAMRYSITSDKDVKINLVTGIDGDVWDIHGPHYESVHFEHLDLFSYSQTSHTNQAIVCEAKVQNNKDSVVVIRSNFIEGATGIFEANEKCGLLHYEIQLFAGVTVDLYSVGTIMHSVDSDAPLEAAKETIKSLGPICHNTYEALLEQSKSHWEAIWKNSEVAIDGDSEAERAMNYSLYHLNIAAPRHKDNLSIPARALSGQTYKGAIFWDSEMFMLDYFLHTQPEVARALVKYRIDTLDGAVEKAKYYGFEGAFYAWESQEGGFDACSDHNVTDVFTKRPVRTYFKDKQVHISSAITWAIMHYFDYTKDLSILLGGGAKTVIECARFYRSAMVHPLHRNRFELHDVIGPDEYHERVNNNAYTNRMAKYTIDAALRVVSILKASGTRGLEMLAQFKSAYDGFDTMIDALKTASEKLYIPKPNEAQLIEQFDGYFRMEDITPEVAKSRLVHPHEYWGGQAGVASDTQVIKQADVVTLLEMFHEDYDEETLKANWAYYEPRTEHGSSLSACMYAMVACRFNDPDRAYPFFMKSATAEIRGGGKQWAGLVYIGGTHPAASGGAWKNLVQGFAGLQFIEGKPVFRPNLPKHWNAISFSMAHSGILYKIKIQRQQSQIKAVIFDLDGVLVSTDHLHFMAWKRLAQEIGATEYTLEDNLRQRGVSRMDSLEVILEKMDQSFSESEKEAMAERKNTYYVESLMCISPNDTLPGARDALERLKIKGIPIALGSASKNAPLILDKVGIKPYFTAIASGHDTTRSKPDPEVFLVAAQKLGLSPNQCLVVEDADAGVEAAIRAGMKVLGVGPAGNNPAVHWSGNDLSDKAIDWEAILKAEYSVCCETVIDAVAQNAVIKDNSDDLR